MLVNLSIRHFSRLFNYQATRPAVIQAHLKKLFAGIHTVAFDPEEKHIVAMNSIDGEVVPLQKKVNFSRSTLVSRNFVGKIVLLTRAIFKTSFLFIKVCLQ